MFWEVFYSVWLTVSPQAVDLRLTPGRSATLPGGDIRVRLVRLLERPGCLGGPRGCPADARLIVTRGDEIRRIVLLYRRGLPTDDQDASASAFGWTLKLRSVDDGEVVLDARPERP